MNNDKSHKCLPSEKILNGTKINIQKYGLQVIMVTSTSFLPSFAYSIGLWESYSHAEIICVGLSTQTGNQIINDVAEIIKSGETIKVGTIYTEIFNNSRATFLNVDTRNVKDYLGAALNYYKNDHFDALQLIWTDRNDKFPWEEDFEDEFLFKQPLLDRNADFKFFEPRNMTSYTTRQWLEEQKPILRVVHDHNGDWQFLSGDQLPEDIRIVALEHLVLRDNTLNQLFDLDLGEAAERDFIGGVWTRYKFDEDEE